MINLERTRPGQILLGRSEAGIDDKRYQPILTVVAVRGQEVEVKNNKGESRLVDPKDLFSVFGTIAFHKAKAREANDLLIKIGAEAIKNSPELAKTLGEHFEQLAGRRRPDPRE